MPETSDHALRLAPGTSRPVGRATEQAYESTVGGLHQTYAGIKPPAFYQALLIDVMLNSFPDGKEESRYSVDRSDSESRQAPCGPSRTEAAGSYRTLPTPLEDR